jgi:hypothetical protein
MKFVINRELAKERGLSKEVIEEIKRDHKICDQITKEMKKLDPVEHQAKLRKLLKEWHRWQYTLQELWGFKKDKKYHKDYLLPHCTCPKLDNEDFHGTKLRWIAEGCPLHCKKK